MASHGSLAGPDADGLVIAGGDSWIEGLAIVRFAGSGLLLRDQGGNTIRANYLGVEPAGTGAGTTS